VADNDELLSGGNVSGPIVRIGNTVRRRAGRWTPAVHALLDHLHAVGFHGAPRPLGIDDQGREVLSYIPGVVPWPDHFHLLQPIGQLRRVARLIREYHDAVQTFTPPPDAAWQTLIPSEGTDIIAHHDLAPWNLVIGDTWAFIDWDNAGPGSRLWDLAYAIHGFIPLSASPQWQTPQATQRLRAFADTYELDEAQRHALAPMLTRRTRSMYLLLAEQAANGVQPWTALWQQGHGQAWLADSDYIDQHQADWTDALLA
jgi:hypothetical protein